MSKAYFGVGGEERTIRRSASHGYKNIKVSENLAMSNLFEFVTEGDDTLVMSPVDGKVDLSKDAVTFICKSFGVSGNVKSKISVMFCDDGEMIVTLLQGMLHVMFDGKVVTPVAGDIGDYQSSALEGIYWIDSDTLLSSKQYFGSELQSRYTQDFEYVFTVSGGIKGGLTQWTCKCNKDEYIDMSLGFIAEAEDKIIRKKRQSDIDRMNALWSSPVSSDRGMEFDIPEDEEYMDEDDEYIDDTF